MARTPYSDADTESHVQDLESNSSQVTDTQYAGNSTPLPPSPFVSDLDSAPAARRGRPPNIKPTPIPPNKLN